MIGSQTVRSLGDALDEERAHKRAVEERETREMLDQAMVGLVRGNNGTTAMGNLVPEGNAVTGQFPKVYPSGMFKDNPRQQTAKKIQNRVLAENAPVDMRIDEHAQRVLGTQGALALPAYPFQVGHLGQDRWKVTGGPWSYIYGTSIGVDDVLVTFDIQDTTVTGRLGWIVLELIGHTIGTISPESFVIDVAPTIRLVSELNTDFSAVMDNGFFQESICSYGHIPLAYVGAPGAVTAGPLIFMRAVPAQIAPDYSAWGEDFLEAHLRFNTWGNTDWS